MSYSKEELVKLSRTSSLIRLLSSKSIDFDQVLKEANYYNELHDLQVELIKMQNWIVEKNKRLLIIFEGGEFAGKGTAIRIFLEHLNPRSAKSIALPKPSKSESGQWYFQRYINRLPNPGEIVLFDRSWYNRAIVEPVNGFCTKKQYQRFMREVNHFENMLHNDDIFFIKIYFTITKEEQAKRIENVKTDPLKRWQLTQVDKNAQDLWGKFKTYEKAMLEHTNTKEVPWTILDGNSKHKAHLALIKHTLSRIPFKK